MTEKRNFVTFPGGQAAYPSFTPGDGENESAERMNDFYLALRDAAVSRGAALDADRSGGLRQLTADYRCRTEADGTLSVEYTLRLRRRGRTEAAKTLLHRWRDGLLCLPQKKQRPRPKILTLFRGRRKP